ncbi:MAG: lamin tail domain-containing protein [Thermoplasmatota archaeon]
MRSLALAVALLSVPLIPAQDGAIQIVELLAEPDGTREFIELENTGPTIDLTGWSIADAAGNRFTFTDQQISAGGRIVVWGGGAATPEGPAWSMVSVWNNAGDTAYLRDAQDNLVASFTYPVAERAARGQAYVWGDGWTTGDPTPGRAPGSQGGQVAGTVPDVPPSLWIDAPEQARGPTFIQFGGEDGNGDAFAWTAQVDGVMVANGTGAFTHNHTLDVQQPSSLRLVAGNQSVEHLIALAPPLLAVQVPAEGLHFPELIPGARNLTATAPFTIMNHGDKPMVARIDFSDFQGPDALPVTGRLEIGISGTWTAYDGPLTQLPQLPPGPTDVWLRLADVPAPLAAGDYGTSFSVVT